MLWILIGLIGCNTPPPVDAQVAYIRDPCGTLSKQITLTTVPDTVVTLNRADDTIAEYRTDANGQARALWSSTSLDGVEAWVGRPNNHSTAVLSEPAPAFNPVWRGAHVERMQCVGIGGGCTVVVQGTDLVVTSTEAVQVQLDGRDADVSADGKTSTIALSQQDVTGQADAFEGAVERCRYVPVGPLRVQVGEATVTGEMWLGVGQATEVYAAIVARDAVEPEVAP